MPINPNTGIDSGSTLAPVGVRAASSNLALNNQPALNTAGQFTRGVRRGVATVKSAAQGLVGAGAAIVGADDFARQQAEEAQQRVETVSQRNPLRIEKVEDIKTFEDAKDFALGIAGQQAPILATLAVGAGVGGLAVRAATGLSAAASAGVGSGAASSALETGLIFPDVANDNTEGATGSLRERALVSGVAGLAAGSLDALPVFQIASRLGLGKSLKSSIRRSIGRRALAGAAETGATEAATETVQTLIERGARKFVNNNFEVLGPEGVSEILNAAVAGGIIGGGLGGLSGAVSPAGGGTQDPVDDFSALDDLDAGEESAVALANKRIAELRGFVDDSELDRIQADAQSFPDQSVFDELDAITPQDVKDIRDSRNGAILERQAQDDPEGLIEDILNRKGSLSLREEGFFKTALGNIAAENPQRAIDLLLDFKGDPARQTAIAAAFENTEGVDLLSFLEDDSDNEFAAIEQEAVNRDSVQDQQQQVDDEGNIEATEAEVINFVEILTRESTDAVTHIEQAGAKFFTDETRSTELGFLNKQGIAENRAEIKIRELEDQFPNELFVLEPARDNIKRDIEDRLGPDVIQRKTTEELGEAGTPLQLSSKPSNVGRRSRHFKLEEKIAEIENTVRKGNQPISFNPDDPLSIFDGQFAIRRSKVPRQVDAQDRLVLRDEDLVPGLANDELLKRKRALDQVRGEDTLSKKARKEILTDFDNIKIRRNIVRDIKRDGSRRNAGEFFVRAKPRRGKLGGKTVAGKKLAISAPALTRRMVNKLRFEASALEGTIKNKDTNDGPTPRAVTTPAEAARAFFVGVTSLRNAGFVVGSFAKKGDLEILQPNKTTGVGETITLRDAVKADRVRSEIAQQPNQALASFINSIPLRTGTDKPLVNMGVKKLIELIENTPGVNPLFAPKFDTLETSQALNDYVASLREAKPGAGKAARPTLTSTGLINVDRVIDRISIDANQGEGPFPDNAFDGIEEDGSAVKILQRAGLRPDGSPRPLLLTENEVSRSTQEGAEGIAPRIVSNLEVEQSEQRLQSLRRLSSESDVLARHTAALVGNEVQTAARTIEFEAAREAAAKEFIDPSDSGMDALLNRIRQDLPTKAEFARPTQDTGSKIGALQLKVENRTAATARQVRDSVKDSTQQGSLRRLVRDWSSLLGVNARVLDIDETVDILLGRNDYGRLRGILDGTLNGFSLPDGRLFVNPQLSANLQVEVLAHEMGHAVFKQTVPTDFDAVHTAWAKWRREFNRPGTLVKDVNASKQRLRTAIESAYNHNELTLDGLSDVDRQYVLDFEEWVADQTALWLTQPNSKPVTSADSWFSNLVSSVRKIFTNVTEDGVVTDAQAEQFLNAKVASFAARMTKTMPHLGARIADMKLAETAPARGAADIILAEINSAKKKRKTRPISEDPLLTAIARLGGLSREDAEANGVDPDEFNKRFFGIKRVFTKKGDTADGITASLVDQGFTQFDTPQGADLNLFLDSLANALAGDPEFAAAKDSFEPTDQEIEDRFADDVFDSRTVAPTPQSVTDAFISAVSKDPTSDTAHVAISNFMSTVLTAKEKRVLGTAFTQGTVRRQMNQLLKDAPRALSDMNSSVIETIAYGYQLWATGMLDLGPQAQGAFGNMLDFFSEAAGNVSNAKQSEQILDQLQEQTFDIDRLMSQGSAFELKSVVRENLLQNVAQSVGDTYSSYAKPWIDRVWAAGLGRLLNTNNPALQQLALKIHTPPNLQGQSQGYLANKESKRVQFFDDISRATQGETDPVRLKQLWEALMTNKVPSDPALAQSMREVRKRLDEIHDYAVRKGLRMGKRKDYFPWVYDREFLQNHKDEFTALLLRPQFKGFMDKFVKQYSAAFQTLLQKQKNDNFKFSKHEATAEQMIERFGVIDRKGVVEIIYENIVDADGYADAEIDFSRASHTPFVRAMNTRSLGFLMTEGTEQDQQDFLKFFQGDFDYTIRTYIDQVVKRAEFTDTFNARKNSDGVIVTDVERLIDEAVDSGASEAEISAAHDFINAAQGTLGARTSQLLGKIPLIGESIGSGKGDELRVINPRLQMAQSWVIVWQNLRVLSMATLTSLADPVGIAVRGGSMDTVMASIKALRKDSRAREVAEKLGIISTYTVNEMLGALYSNNFMSAAAQATNEKFFKYTGLSALTRATRAMATGAGLEFLRTHALGKSENSERFLADLNLEAKDVELDDQSNVKLRTRPEMDTLWREYESTGDKTILAEIEREERVRKAINRFVDEAILRPNAATRPIWASDPHFALLFHLKSFIYTFHNQILKRVYNEAVLGNYTPFALLFVYVPFMIFADLLRDIVRFGADGNPRKNNWSLLDYTTNAVERSGLYGLGQIALDAKQDVDFGGLGVSSFLGPTAGSISAIDDIMFDADSGRLEGILDQLPFQNTIAVEGFR